MKKRTKQKNKQVFPPATPDFFPHFFRIISAVVLGSVLISNFIFSTFSPSSSFDKAKQEILKEPNKPGGYLKLADEFLKVNNFEEAKKELSLGLSFSFDSSLKKKIGEVEEEIRKPSEIRKEILEWEKIVSEKPDYRDGFLRLALLYYRIFAKEKARENLNKALAVDPNFKPAREIEKRFFSD